MRMKRDSNSSELENSENKIGEGERPLRPAQLAERWGCSRQFVHNLIRKGVLGHFRLGGKLIRIPAEEVRKLEARLQTTRSESSTDGERRERERLFYSVLNSVRNRSSNS